MLPVRSAIVPATCVPWPSRSSGSPWPFLSFCGSTKSLPQTNWAGAKSGLRLKPGVRVAVYALVGTVFTVVVQGAMNVALTPFGIPTLTAPFVL
ncbi:MAG: hypothetical protein F9K43_29875, partial [Bauldia sp.]